MSARAEFSARAAQQIMVFDGGYGTAIQAYRLSEADYRARWSWLMTKKAIMICCRLHGQTSSKLFIWPISMPVPI